MPDYAGIWDALSETIGKYRPTCPICKEENWTIAHLDLAQRRDVTRQPPDMTYAVADCGTCGYSMSFRSAMLTGEYQREQAESEDEEPSDDDAEE